MESGSMNGKDPKKVSIKLKESHIIEACINPNFYPNVKKRLTELLPSQTTSEKETKIRKIYKMKILEILRNEGKSLQSRLVSCIKISNEITLEALRENHNEFFKDNESRKKIWLIISLALKEKKSNETDYYNNLLKISDKFPHKYEEVIQMDIKRTSATPDQKRILANVLTAYSRRNMSIGYLQGMNFMAKLILNVIEDEEDTFWVLVYVCEVLLETNYLNSMEGVIMDQTILKKILKNVNPSFLQKIDDLGFKLTSISFKWFICLFTICPIKEELKISIWDFLILGDKATLFKTSLILIEDSSDKIMEFTDMSEILMFYDKDLGHHFAYSGAQLAKKLSDFYLSWDMIILMRTYSFKQVKEHLSKERRRIARGNCDPCSTNFFVCQKYFGSQQKETDDFFILQTEKPFMNRIDSYFSLRRNFWRSDLEKFKNRRNPTMEQNLLVMRTDHTCLEHDMKKEKQDFLNKILEKKNYDGRGKSAEEEDSGQNEMNLVTADEKKGENSSKRRYTLVNFSGKGEPEVIDLEEEIEDFDHEESKSITIDMMNDFISMRTFDSRGIKAHKDVN